MTVERLAGSFSIDVSTGNYSLKSPITLCIMKLGKSILLNNGYRFDLIYEKDLNFKNPEKFYILVSMDKDMIVSSKKPLKVKNRDLNT